MTALDTAHAAMEASDDDAPRRAFYDRLATAELVLLLDKEPVGDEISPAVFDLDTGPTVVAFDSEERLTTFTGAPAPYAALPGRVLAQMLAGQGVALGLNLSVAPSSTLLPAEAMVWLAERLAGAPDEARDRPAELRAPRLPRPLMEALDHRLARASGLVARVYLAQAVWDDGSDSPLVALVGAAPGAETALAQSVAEAARFAEDEGLRLDIAFFEAGEPMTDRLERVAWRVDLPEPQPERPAAPRAPGSDPAKPPKLR
ncbi:SseB family protein [Mesobaculum littorinae]|uniref:SseB family protein n=1 Tax=Mesobaculum littorinae TaxID=2486419 RepID=UPI0019D4A3B5